MLKTNDGTTYTTPNGLNLLKEWGTAYTKHMHTAKNAAWRLLASLEIVHGSDLVDGLAYTSSSDFAAVWNCNTEARKIGTDLYFNGIAITDAGAPVAVYDDGFKTFYELI